MTARPELLVLAGPSGAGKTTIARRLVEEAPERFVLSVSATTRRPRPGERTGVEYDFVSREEFEAMIRAGALAEWAVVHGHCYGTPWRSLSALAEPNAGSASGFGAIAVRDPGLAPARVVGRSEPKTTRGPILVLDIDIQGARQVVARMRDALVIFVVPPGPGPWLKRLRGRGTESSGEIAKRLSTALREIEEASSLCDAPSFGGFVVNEAVVQAARDVMAAVEADGGTESASDAEQAKIEALCRDLAQGARLEIARLEGTAPNRRADAGLERTERDRIQAEERT